MHVHILKANQILVYIGGIMVQSIGLEIWRLKQPYFGLTPEFMVLQCLNATGSGQLKIVGSPPWDRTQDLQRSRQMT